MNNQEFLQIVKSSFEVFLETGSRSNEKLKVLHGAIAKDLNERLGQTYHVRSLGYKSGKEVEIQGRYIDKKVDITVVKNDVPVAGIGVKFVMQNYSQNSNNYFENMLGETANIKCSNIPYFQIFIIPDKLPYYEKNGELKHWESFTGHNVQKYIILSNDREDVSFHTPTKTLLFVIHLPEIGHEIHSRKEYIYEYQNMDDFNVRESEMEYGNFASSVIYNNYDEFMRKMTYRILSE